MVRVVFEDGLEALAREIAKSVDGEVVKLENAMNAPDVLEDISHVGLLYYKCGKDISDNMIKFICNGLGSIELKNMEYLFSICVCEGEVAKPQYALKVVNRLCSHVGCLPSYSTAMLESDFLSVNAPQSETRIEMSKDRAAVLNAICNDLKNEEIKLPYGSPFVGWYMKLAKKRFDVYFWCTMVGKI